MSLSHRKRFEIFKRDNFTCRYCGSSSPEVVLEVDHVVPRAEGGSDDTMNLVTSCFDCNRGKGAVPLTDIVTGGDPHDEAILLLERERQLREYNEVLRAVREREEADLYALEEHWKSLTSDERESLRRFLQTIPVEKIKQAMDISIGKGKTWNLRYVFGILHTWIRESGE